MQEDAKVKASWRRGVLQEAEEAQPMASPLLLQEQKHAAVAWSTPALHSTPVPQAAETQTGISGCLPSSWARERHREREKTSREEQKKNKSIDTRRVDILPGAFSLMAPHQQLHSHAFLLLHLCILKTPPSSPLFRETELASKDRKPSVFPSIFSHQIPLWARSNSSEQ